jgi:hypothetical protein
MFFAQFFCFFFGVIPGEFRIYGATGNVDVFFVNTAGNEKVFYFRTVYKIVFENFIYIDPVQRKVSNNYRYRG